MPEPCPFPQNRWGLGLGMLSTDVFIGRELIRRYLVHAENESLRCRVAEVIFYGSLKGGTMAIWLPFKCFSQTAEDINPNVGLAETILFLFGGISICQDQLCFQKGGGLQPRAASNWPLVQHELRGEEHARFSATVGSSGTPRGWSARAAVNRKAEGKHAYSWHSWLWYFWMGWLMLVAFKTNGQNTVSTNKDGSSTK